jgi:hypothetical protein
MELEQLQQIIREKGESNYAEVKKEIQKIRVMTDTINKYLNMYDPLKHEIMDESIRKVRVVKVPGS